MNHTKLGNFCVQSVFGSVLCGPLQSLTQYMATCNPCKCIATGMRYGEKSVFPFADDIAELFLHRCRSDKIEDRKFSGRKDFKMYRGGLNIRHVILRSHIAANSAVIKLNKATPLVLMTVADPNYQPVMEELCSAERYNDAETVYMKMIADRLLDGYSSLGNFSHLKLQMKSILRNVKKPPSIEFQKHSKRRTKSQLENFQLLVNRISRTERLTVRDFSPFSIKRSKLIKMYGTKSEKSN